MMGKNPMKTYDGGETLHMHLVLSQLAVAVEPKGFQYIPVECSAPGTGYSKQLFMDDWSIHLEGSDDKA